MARTRITDLPAKADPIRDDLIAIVDMQAASPTTKKTSLGHLLDILDALTWADLGVPGGVASLDNSGKINASQLPEILLGATGATGAQGITGATGPAGATGASGPAVARAQLVL